MTGAQTDPVNVPACERAACRLLRLATSMFTIIIASGETGPETECDRLMSHWYELRRIAAKFTDNRDLVLSVVEREKMVGALKVAHDLSHDYDVIQGAHVPPVSACTCPTAQAIQELTLDVVNAEGVPCA